MGVVELSGGGPGPSHPTATARGMGIKRVFDVVVGVTLCLVALPVVGVLVVILAVQHRAFPLFVHTRIGQGGEPFSIPKLRTLAPDHDPYADKTAGPIEASSRLTAFLRQSHLDELPQLFLVPVGRLSLVGPRPRMECEATECVDPDNDRLRVTVPQGCTGLWQISVDKGGRVSDHLEYDRFYIEQRTLRMDLWILWRTLAQAVGARLVALPDVPAWVLGRSGARDGVDPGDRGFSNSESCEARDFLRAPVTAED